MRAEWFACWTQAQKDLGSIAVATLSGNSLRQTVHTHCPSVHQAAKLVAALLRVAGVAACLAESNGSLPPGLWHVTCRLTAKNRDQLRNPTLSNREWATFTFYFMWQVTLNLTFQQAVTGCTRPVTVSVVGNCPTCDGQKVEPGTRKQRCLHCNGTGRVSWVRHCLVSIVAWFTKYLWFILSKKVSKLLPSVLWRCWLGGRKGIRPVKNWVVGCWHGYLSGARCRLAYSAADATATHCLLLQ